MRLADVPGLGPQWQERLLAHFDDEATVLAALSAADIEALVAVPQVTPRRAATWIGHAKGHDRNLLATPMAKKVWEEIQARLASYAVTEAGRLRLGLLAPLGTQTEAESLMAEVGQMRILAETSDRDAQRQSLRRVARLKPAAPRLDASLLIVAEDDGIYERLHGFGLGRWCRLGTRRDLEEADAYDVVVVAYDDGMDVPVDHAVEVRGDAALAQLCPEAVLTPLRAQRTCLESLAALHPEGAAARLLPHLATTTERPADPLPAIDAALATAIEEADTALADLSLNAADLMQSLASGSPPSPVRAILESSAREANARLSATFPGLAPIESTTPLSIDEEAVQAWLRSRNQGDALSRFAAAQKAAALAERLRPDIEEEIQQAFDLDVELALGSFASDHDLHPATFGDRFQMDSSVHLSLATLPEAQRIHYELGERERIALLTGANSGGKSTFLEHMAQTVLMAQAGLGCVGHVVVPWIDEVHLVTAQRGLDAGALETFLRSFIPLAHGDARRLVLADEIEAVTELQAAGKMIGFVLRRLASSDSFGVVASHLADQLLDLVDDIRIDGIEARGLDEAHQLIVDRCPRIGVRARSTPELVVQRLAATAPAQQRDLFQDLLDHLQGTVTAAP